MASLQTERYAKIAQLVNWGATAILKRQVGSLSPGLDEEKLVRVVWESALKGSFDVEFLTEKGYEFAVQAAGLKYLILQGTVTPREADAFLSERFPALQYSEGNFEDQFAQLTARTSIEAQAKPTGDEAAQQAIEDVVSVQQGVYSGPPAGIPYGATGLAFQGQVVQHHISTPRIKRFYDQQNLSRAFRNLSSETSLALTQIANGQIRHPIASLDGRAIAPGTLPFSAIEPYSMARGLRDMPGPDQAIKLRVAPDYSTDREIEHTAILDQSGPGRVWRVVAAEYPQGYEPKPGPVRYRIVVPDLRFGIMGYRYDGTTVEVEFGVVIRGIPSFLGRVPQAILYAPFEGDPPSALWASHVNQAATQESGEAMTASTRLFHGTGATTGRAYTDFVAEVKTAWASFPAAPDAVQARVVPTSSGANPDLAQVKGVWFNLVTGRTAEEVYGELNSKESLEFCYIGGDGRGPTASAPPGQAVDSPCVADCVVVSGAGPTTFAGILEGAAVLNGNSDFVEGLPFSYAACQRLAASAAEFSVVVRPALRKLMTAAFGSTIPGPGSWDLCGIRAVAENDRALACDIVIV